MGGVAPLGVRDPAVPEALGRLRGHAPQGVAEDPDHLLAVHREAQPDVLPVVLETHPVELRGKCTGADGVGIEALDVRQGLPVRIILGQELALVQVQVMHDVEGDGRAPIHISTRRDIQLEPHGLLGRPSDRIGGGRVRRYTARDGEFVVNVLEVSGRNGTHYGHTHFHRRCPGIRPWEWRRQVHVERCIIPITHPVEERRALAIAHPTRCAAPGVTPPAFVRVGGGVREHEDLGPIPGFGVRKRSPITRPLVHHAQALLRIADGDEVLDAVPDGGEVRVVDVLRIVPQGAVQPGIVARHEEFDAVGAVEHAVTIAREPDGNLPFAPRDLDGPRVRGGHGEACTGQRGAIELPDTFESGTVRVVSRPEGPVPLAEIDPLVAVGLLPARGDREAGEQDHGQQVFHVSLCLNRSKRSEKTLE